MEQPRISSIRWKTIKTKHKELKENRDYFSAFNFDWCGLVDELNKSFPAKMITIINSENPLASMISIRSRLVFLRK